jgi:hypothetical protein
MSTPRSIHVTSLCLALVLSACGVPLQGEPPAAPRPARPELVAVAPPPVGVPVADCAERRAAPARRRAPAEPSSQRHRGPAARSALVDRGACPP